uniref:Uncharacterized protein n=1 Tax=Sipha flava TaxID=143950 RepID=A0A2S2PVG1_9HEMI
MPQMLSIIKIIFINSQDLPSCCVINAISILSHFLSCPSVELSSKLYNTSMSISEEICKSVTGKCIIDSYVVDISSNLSCGLLRLYSTIASRILLNEHLQKHKKVAKSLKNIAWFMIKHIILPFVLKNMNVSLHYKSCRKGIKSLLSPFRESLPLDVLQNIANYYAASKIISILFESIEYKQIGILSEELLFEMMFHLSSAYLKIDSHWPGGIDMFRNQLVWSFKDFPGSHY